MPADNEEELPIVVCAAWEEVDIRALHTDNLKGECHRCGQEVMYRPHSPSPARRVCTDCFLDLYDPSEHQIAVTQKTVEELQVLYKKGLQ